MKYRQPGYNAAFACLGGACPDTCCRDWEIVLDEDALADCRSAPPGLRERLADSLRVGEDGEVCFALRPDGRCALLTPEGLCAIQRDWGEEHLCLHCAAYPRFTEEYGCLTETALAVSCPEAARLLMEAADFRLEERDDGQDDPPFPGVDPALLAGLEATRARALALLGEGDLPLGRRLDRLLGLGARCQHWADLGRYGELADCRPEPVEGEGTAPPREPALRLMEVCAGLEPLRAAWPELLRRGAARLRAMDGDGYRQAMARFARENPGWEDRLAKLACYLVFRHWHKAVNDERIYGRAALVRGACLLICHLMLVRWQEEGALSQGEEIALWSAFSREVEHLEDNLTALMDWLEGETLA